uniref:Uncharacterized protein n=1 Tax=Arundo donax TaxID=35708 RepID=A0A0A9FWR8_ARUDO
MCIYLLQLGKLKESDMPSNSILLAIKRPS